jgi:3-dehydroquinate dehydratase/shikimate dehydrogenase
MTLLIASCFAEVPDSLSGVSGVSGIPGGDLLEIRIDGLSPSECSVRLPDLLSASTVPTIVTCRSVTEGGFFDGEEEERIEMYTVALQSNHPPRYIDVEYEAFTQQPSMLDSLSSESTGVILSWHDVQSRPKNLLQRAQEMQQVQEADVVKIVWQARSIRDNIEAFELLRTRQKPMIVLCMGECGVMSRVLAPKFGGFATYASIDGVQQTAVGQPTLREFQSMYQFDAIDSETKVYGVIGSNVAHSSSPQFHNAAFQAAGMNAVYLPLQIPDGFEHLKASFGELCHYDSLHFSGASITIPHKEEMIKLVDACDDISSTVGATNTVTNSDQTSSATNTDVMALASLTTNSRKAIVLGGGGVARAAIVALQMGGAEVFIATRRSEQAVALANEFSCNSVESDLEDIDTIVNCTPVGMEGGEYRQGNPLQELVPHLALQASMRVIDTVYNPKETPLLLQAIHAGCDVVYGEEMFRLQAVAQQKLWGE